MVSLCSPVRFDWRLHTTCQSSFALTWTQGTRSPCGDVGSCQLIIAHVRLETRYIDIIKSISIIDHKLHIHLY